MESEEYSRLVQKYEGQHLILTATEDESILTRTGFVFDGRVYSINNRLYGNSGTSVIRLINPKELHYARNISEEKVGSLDKAVFEAVRDGKQQTTADISVIIMPVRKRS